MKNLLAVSFRRSLLDRDLVNTVTTVEGLVVDLGGEWQKRRGSFRPPEQPGLRWICLNVDPSVAPDVISDIAHASLVDACADAVVCTEVLEHVVEPERVLAGAYRLLKPAGRLIASIPFMAGVHGDPYDYQRYTASKLELILKAQGFCNVVIRSQGLYFTVLADLVRAGLVRLQPRALRGVILLATAPILNWLTWREQRTEPSAFAASYVAGYFITARKPGSS